MFTDSDSFYYSPGGDLTNTVQRQATAKDNSDGVAGRNGLDVDMDGGPEWTRADDRFFWNHYMLQDLISAQVGGCVCAQCAGGWMSVCSVLRWVDVCVLSAQVGGCVCVLSAQVGGCVCA